jgi:hypothetical protein
MKGSINPFVKIAENLKCYVWIYFWPCFMIIFSWLMEMKFSKMKSRRVRGLRVLIILGHDKFPTFVVGKKDFFFLLDF